MTTNPTPLDLLRDAESYLSALHGSVARHDNLAANLGCAGCELRDRIGVALTAAPSSPSAARADDRAGLRDRIAEALAAADGWTWTPDFDRNLSPVWKGYLKRASAVMSVLPQPADRGAVLRWAAGQILAADLGPRPGHTEDYSRGWSDATHRAESYLRMLADEAQPQPDTETREAHRPHHRWYVETYDYLADEWAPGQRFTTRSDAAERHQALNQSRPAWDDGTPVKRRLVRETTTYTVEAAVVSQPGKDQEA